MRMKSILTILALTVLVTVTSMAQYFAKESFDYPKGTTIDTMMGGAGNGWGGPWYKIVASQKNAMVVSDTAMPYDATAYAVPHVGGSLSSKPDSNGTELRYGRHLAKMWPNDSGKVYWVSVLMDVKNATDNSTWCGVKFYGGDASEQGMLGKGHGLDKYTCGGGWHGGTGPEVSNVAWTVGPVWLVAKTVMYGSAVGASQDSIYMWISPDPAGVEPKVATADAKTSLKFAGGFDVIRIEYGGSVGPKGFNASFDELRLGTTWGDVSSEFGFIPTGIQRQNNLPSHFALHQNYPNPFNPSSIITYELKNTGKIRLAVYDVIGREVAVLVNGVQSEGQHQVTFSANNLPSGVYFYRLETTESSITKKMMLMK